MKLLSEELEVNFKKNDSNVFRQYNAYRVGLIVRFKKICIKKF